LRRIKCVDDLNSNSFLTESLCASGEHYILHYITIIYESSNWIVNKQVERILFIAYCAESPHCYIQKLKQCIIPAKRARRLSFYLNICRR